MTLTLPHSFEELGKMTCKEPISVEVYFIDRKTKTAHFRWDFGMEGSVSLDNFILQGRGIKGIKNKILSDVIFDIGHAFFHYEGDPNYTDYHWALAGWLAPRILAEPLPEEGEPTPKSKAKGV
jgi:hypothetical protein